MSSACRADHVGSSLRPKSLVAGRPAVKSALEFRDLFIRDFDFQPNFPFWFLLDPHFVHRIFPALAI